MTAQPLRLTGFSRGTHVEVVSRSRDALIGVGASILDFHMFSNAILCLTFEIAPEALSSLPAALADAGVSVDAVSRTAMEEAIGAVSGAASDDASERLEGSLSINLINDEPALRIEVPAVPG